MGGLLIEILLALIELVVDLLPLSVFGKSVVLSSVASLWVLQETWKESPHGQRPSPFQVLFLYWPGGTAFLILFFTAATSLNRGINVQLTPIELRPTPTPIVLVVTPTPSPTPTLPYGYEKVCSTAPPSPFDVGRRGYICNTHKILLREKPSLRSRVIAVIPPQVKFEVIDGPECGYYRVWWKIRLSGNPEPYHNGLVGWMPETSPRGEEVYLCPLP